jgi:hypothetical protein
VNCATAALFKLRKVEVLKAKVEGSRKAEKLKTEIVKPRAGKTSLKIHAFCLMTNQSFSSGHRNTTQQLERRYIL